MGQCFKTCLIDRIGSLEQHRTYSETALNDCCCRLGLVARSCLADVRRSAAWRIDFCRCSKKKKTHTCVGPGNCSCISSRGCRCGCCLCCSRIGLQCWPGYLSRSSTVHHLPLLESECGVPLVLQNPVNLISVWQNARIMIYDPSSIQFQRYLLKHVRWRNIVEDILVHYEAGIGTQGFRRNLCRIRHLINIRCCAPDFASDASSDASALLNLSLSADGRCTRPIVDYIVWLLNGIRTSQPQLCSEFCSKFKHHNDNVVPHLKRTATILSAQFPDTPMCTLRQTLWRHQGDVVAAAIAIDDDMQTQSGAASEALRRLGR